MLETFIVVGVIVLLVLLGLTAVLLPLGTILVVGLVCIGVGFVVGMPAGAYYHLKLYRFLTARGEVPRSFWLRPTSFHALLEPAEWKSVVPWFVAGGAGFLMIVLGCLIVMIGVLKS